jgi:hypothetical protein
MGLEILGVAAVTGGAMEEDTQSFIVRIWRELVGKDGRALLWRGSINHVGSNQRLYFRDFESVVEFIRNKAGLRTEPGSWWKLKLTRIRQRINLQSRRR